MTKKYKALKPSQIGRYAAGRKRCNYCEIFVDYDGLVCPCCNRQLRCLPRSRKGKISRSDCKVKLVILSYPRMKVLLIRNQYQ